MQGLCFLKFFYIFYLFIHYYHYYFLFIYYYYYFLVQVGEGSKKCNLAVGINQWIFSLRYFLSELHDKTFILSLFWSDLVIFRTVILNNLTLNNRWNGLFGKIVEKNRHHSYTQRTNDLIFCFTNAALQSQPRVVEVIVFAYLYSLFLEAQFFCNFDCFKII